MKLSFDYSGDRSGTLAIDTTAVGGIWRVWARSRAASFFDSESNTQDIIAQRVRSDLKVDLMWLWVEGRVTAPRTASVAAEDGWLILGLDGSGSYEGAYEVTSGSITFSDVTALKLGGSFSLVMHEVSSDAPLTVTAGTFDLPIVHESVPSGMAVPAAVISRFEMMRTR